MNDYAAIADLYDAYVTEERELGFWRWCAETWPGPILELTAGTGRAVLPDAPAVRALAGAAGFAVERLFGDYDRSAFAAERSPFMLWVLRPAAGAR